MQQLFERVFDGFLFDSPPSLPLKSLKTDIYDYIKPHQYTDISVGGQY